MIEYYLMSNKSKKTKLYSIQHDLYSNPLYDTVYQNGIPIGEVGMSYIHLCILYVALDGLWTRIQFLFKLHITHVNILLFWKSLTKKPLKFSWGQIAIHSANLWTAVNRVNTWWRVHIFSIRGWIGTPSKWCNQQTWHVSAILLLQLT